MTSAGALPGAARRPQGVAVLTPGARLEVGDLRGRIAVLAQPCRQAAGMTRQLHHLGDAVVAQLPGPFEQGIVGDVAQAACHRLPRAERGPIAGGWRGPIAGGRRGVIPGVG